MFPPFHFFSNGYQPFLFLLNSLHLPHLFTFSITLFFSFFSLQKPPSPLFSSHFLTLSNSLILSFSLYSLFISSNGTQGQEDLLHPFLWCIPPHPLEWGNEVNGASTINMLARESHSYGWICKFSIFFFHFQVSLWSFILMCFWPCKCLGFAMGWV